MQHWREELDLSQLQPPAGMVTAASHRYPAQVIATVSIVKMLKKLPALKLLTVTNPHP